MININVTNGNDLNNFTALKGQSISLDQTVTYMTWWSNDDIYKTDMHITSCLSALVLFDDVTDLKH